MQLVGIVLIILSIVQIVRVNKRKQLLNESDMELLYKYRRMIDNKQVRPEQMSDWETNIWELAQKDKENQFTKNAWLVFIILMVVGCLVIEMATK